MCNNYNLQKEGALLSNLLKNLFLLELDYMGINNKTKRSLFVKLLSNNHINGIYLILKLVL